MTGRSSQARRERASDALLAALVIGWFLLYRYFNPLVCFLIDRLMRLPPGTSLQAAIDCRLIGLPRTLLLLPAVVFVMGLVRSFFPPQRTRSLLTRRAEGSGVLFAALLGMVTPFCSCSAVPLFLGFVAAGVPLSACFTFLIASPMVNEVALALLASLVGWKTAVLYALAGLGLAVTAGWTMGRLGGESGMEEWVQRLRASGGEMACADPSWSQRLQFACDAVREVMGRVWVYVLAGIAAALLIRLATPEGMLESLMGRGAWWAVPAAVGLGVPIYAGAAGVVPVVAALLEKGAALGTVLAFMMAVVGLSLPEWVILRRVLRRRVIATLLAIMAAGMMGFGWTLNAVLPPPPPTRAGARPGVPVRQVQVLGEECEACAQLLVNALQAARQSHVTVRVEKVSDFRTILTFGTAVTPALAIDGQVVSAGKVLTPAEIRALLEAPPTSSPPPTPPK
ncbi:MAG: MTH895/ArsE family thioredoxin-like protein [Armatimonadota bacterium]|nr:MTH895/ArsE family thioredoxin-like protein [Armatimonadota bacterium]